MLSDLNAYIRAIAKKHHVPAISVAVYMNGSMKKAACGVLNVETQVEADVDSVFQIGSISKVFTASLIMDLVDAGKIELDRPVREYLPAFHVADPGATERITVRNLLSHTSGLVSDLYVGGEDADGSNLIERYVDQCFLLPQVHRDFGKRFSYSNAGYVIAGRIVEVATGMSWAGAVERLILRPLEMTQTSVRPAQTLRFRAAMGHLIKGNDPSNLRVETAAACYMPQALAPAGATLAMTAADLIKFGRAHWDNGRSASSRPWLTETSIAAMQYPQVSIPFPTLLSEDGWGLGWALSRSRGPRAFGHAGGTIGQQSLLEVYPEFGLVLAAQLNGMALGGAPVLQDILDDVFYQATGRGPGHTGERPQLGPLTRFTGTFGVVGWRIRIDERGGQLQAELVADAGGDLPPQSFKLTRIADNTFEARTEGGVRADYFTFLDPDSLGIPQYLFSAYRLHPRVASS